MRTDSSKFVEFFSVIDIFFGRKYDGYGGDAQTVKNFLFQTVKIFPAPSS
jgi:hypothetical protein